MRGEFSFFLNAGIVDHHCLNPFSNSNRLIIFHTCTTGTFYISRLTFTRRTFTSNRITWLVDTMPSAGGIYFKISLVYTIQTRVVKLSNLKNINISIFCCFFYCFLLALFCFSWFFYFFKRLKHTSFL